MTEEEKSIETVLRQGLNETIDQLKTQLNEKEKIIEKLKKQNLLLMDNIKELDKAVHDQINFGTSAIRITHVPFEDLLKLRDI